MIKLFKDISGSSFCLAILFCCLVVFICMISFGGCKSNTPVVNVVHDTVYIHDTLVKHDTVKIFQTIKHADVVNIGDN